MDAQTEERTLIRLCTTRIRRDERGGSQERSITFNGGGKPSLLADGLAPVVFFDEITLRSGAELDRQASFDGVTIIYVRKGTIRCTHSMGTSEVIRAGAFLRLPSSCRSSWKHENQSQTQGAELFEIGVMSVSPALESGRERRRITAAERRSVLRIVASPDGRQGSLPLAGDLTVYSTLLLPGQHVVHETTSERRMWIQVIEGKVTVGPITVSKGNGAVVSDERGVSLTAKEGSEILLIDLGAVDPNDKDWDAGMPTQVGPRAGESMSSTIRPPGFGVVHTILPA
jgi:redox-sensitive bicupin YhaK (pirin superfamily)